MLHSFEKMAGLPPLKQAIALVSGESGKRLEAILGRFENLAKDREAVGEVSKLLQLIKDLDESGGLAKLEKILDSLPKGKSGETMIAGLTQLLEGLGGKIEQLTKLANTILSQDD